MIKLYLWQKIKATSDEAFNAGKEIKAIKHLMLHSIASLHLLPSFHHTTFSPFYRNVMSLSLYPCTSGAHSWGLSRRRNYETEKLSTTYGSQNVTSLKIAAHGVYLHKISMSQNL